MQTEYTKGIQMKCKRNTPKGIQNECQVNTEKEYRRFTQKEYKN